MLEFAAADLYKLFMGFSVCILQMFESTDIQRNLGPLKEIKY